jgi:hypothetical protein
MQAVSRLGDGGILELEDIIRSYLMAVRVVRDLNT